MPTIRIVPGRRPGTGVRRLYDRPEHPQLSPEPCRAALPDKRGGPGTHRPGWPVSVALPVVSTSDAGDHPVVERRNIAGDLQSPGWTAGGSTSTSLQHRRSHHK